MSLDGTARDALAVTAFRRVFFASLASSTGRWMQNVVLGAFAWEFTKSPSFTTLVIFAQLFPLLTLSIVGGSLADSVDRRKLLVLTQSWQALWGLVLAWQVWDGEITRPLLLLIVFMTGLGQALFAPAFTSVLPSLVGRENLTAAISLNSMQVNGSRVVGPVLGTALLPIIGIGGVFLVNSATYLFVIIALATVALPPVTTRTLSAADRLLGGLRVARKVEQVQRPLAIMTLFSLFCLPFIGLLPVIAGLHLNVDADSATYGWMYAAFGVGAFGGAAAAGTILLRVPKEQIVRGSLVMFALSLTVLAVIRDVVLAYPTLFFVGLFYFVMPTALSTFLQQHLEDSIRGRVMALWVISFGGVISITNLLSGKIVELTSLTAVLCAGAVVAAGMGIFIRLVPGPSVGDEVLV